MIELEDFKEPEICIGCGTDQPFNKVFRPGNPYSQIPIPKSILWKCKVCGYTLVTKTWGDTHND